MSNLPPHFLARGGLATCARARVRTCVCGRSCMSMSLCLYACTGYLCICMRVFFCLCLTVCVSLFPALPPPISFNYFQLLPTTTTTTTAPPPPPPPPPTTTTATSKAQPNNIAFLAWTSTFLSPKFNTAYVLCLQGWSTGCGSRSTGPLNTHSAGSVI